MKTVSEQGFTPNGGGGHLPEKQQRPRCCETQFQHFNYMQHPFERRTSTVSTRGFQVLTTTYKAVGDCQVLDNTP